MRELTRKLEEYGGQCRITIPKHLVQMLGWENKDEIRFTADHDEIKMRKVRT